MDSNTHSTRRPRTSDDLAALVAAVDGLAAQDLAGLPDAVRAERVLVLRRLLDRLEGHWLAELAGVDARGAAGAEAGLQASSTASWLRQRLRMSAGAAHSTIRTARALFRGPLGGTAKALTDGELSLAHASVLAHGTDDLPTLPSPRPNPSCWTRPDGWTHPGCGGCWATCGWSPTPTAPPARPSGGITSGACG